MTKAARKQPALKMPEPPSVRLACHCGGDQRLRTVYTEGGKPIGIQCARCGKSKALNPPAPKPKTTDGEVVKPEPMFEPEWFARREPGRRVIP